MNKVIDGLYVGGKLAVEKANLLQHKITHILAVTTLTEPCWPEEFKYKNINVTDTFTTELSPYFSECVDFIHDCRMNGGAVLVHCMAGISRSVTITVAYLMTVSELSGDHALTVVHHCRRMANPNVGFRCQLMEYEKKTLTAERARIQKEFPNSEKLKDDGALKELLACAESIKVAEIW